MRLAHPLAAAAALALVVSSPALAGSVPTPLFNAPIVFSQAGDVTLTLEGAEGGFDHFLELAATTGAPSTSPLMVLTALSDPSTSVLGLAPAAAGATAGLGFQAAGSEIVLRLTNIGSTRLGTVGELGDQIFTGSASLLNPQPTQYYSLLEWLSPTQVRVQMEDLFPTDPSTNPTSLDGWDVQFLLTLAPVPEPGTWALWLGALGAAALRGGARMRRRA